jgi:murein DD-endopeptidase MepM/ murein hydrolase activator NlpD
MKTVFLYLSGLLFISLTACQQGPVSPAGAWSEADPFIAAEAEAASEGAATAVFSAGRTTSVSTTTPTRPTATPLPTDTPTPTPTPWPQAPPLYVHGDPRAGLLQPPRPQAHAPCGVVDLLDFPMDPPHGREVRGGQDFGVFRGRYDKYHAGEDWWNAQRGATLGMPVYSIGHGRVTYADPEGWNRDKGVVIIEHVLANGRTVLSFYGHLDPPTVVRQPGTCVARGDLIGLVGQPRTSPHLHFEIRTQSPYAPLSGYWPDDPTLAGWLPPSAFIWEQRIGQMPDVIWLRPREADGTVGLGLVGDTAVILQNNLVQGLDLANGQPRWQLVETAVGAALDDTQEILYAAYRSGDIVALPLATMIESDPTPIWQQRLDVVLGTPTLIPLPEGGLVVATRQHLFGLDAEGQMTWHQSTAGRVTDWAVSDGGLFVATRGGESDLWWVTADAARPWPTVGSGYLAQLGEQVWFYTGTGLYRLEVAAETAVLLHPLPPHTPTPSGLIPLAEGGGLLLQSDAHDRRLIAFNPDGSLRWQRSLARAVVGRLRLVYLDQQPYLLAEDNRSSYSQVMIYMIDPAQVELTHIFSGGTRAAKPHDTWLLAGSGHLLLNIGGGHMVAIQP